MPTCASRHISDANFGLQENGHIFEGLRTIAAYYLRADSSSICECIQAFCLNDLLFSIARLECSFKKTLQSGHRAGEILFSHSSQAQRQHNDLTSKVVTVSKLSSMTAGGYRHSMIAKAAEHAVGQKELADPNEVEAVRGVVAALMHELECILHEYLSFNWDRVVEIYNANKHLLREEGLVCAWKSVACLAVSCLPYDLCVASNLSSFPAVLAVVGRMLADRGYLAQSLPSTPSVAGTSPRTWDLDSTPSGSYNNLTELDQPSTPNSEHSGLYETFDEYLAKKVHSRTGSTMDGVQKQLENLSKSEVELESEQNPWQPDSTATGDENGARRASSAAAGKRTRYYCAGLLHSCLGVTWQSTKIGHWQVPQERQHRQQEGEPLQMGWQRTKATQQGCAQLEACQGGSDAKNHRGHARPTEKVRQWNPTLWRLPLQRRRIFAASPATARLAYRFLTLRQMFEDLNRVPDHSAPSQRQPIILLLGGGMAAGKSTVREIIGRDGFWTKVRFPLLLPFHRVASCYLQ